MKLSLFLPFFLAAFRIVAFPFALLSAAFVREEADHLELDTNGDTPLSIENGTIRTRVIAINPTRNAIDVNRIEMSVSDSLGTFVLCSKTAPTSIPAGYSLSVELVASDFLPLRLSRHCSFRARFFNPSGCLCTLAHSFTNVWPAEHFDLG